MIKAVNPYINLPGNTEEAFGFYRSVFGGELAGVVRFGDFPENMGVAEEHRDRIANIGLPLGEHSMLMGTDVVGPWAENYVVGTNTYIHIEVDSGQEADRVFDALAEGGHVEMALTRTEWAEKYGSCRDRFGVQWMISYTGSVVWEG